MTHLIYDGKKFGVTAICTFYDFVIYGTAGNTSP